MDYLFPIKDGNVFFKDFFWVKALKIKSIFNKKGNMPKDTKGMMGN